MSASYSPLALEACPFCGNEPSFSGNASEWKDDYRYVELSLGCCVSMSEQIGWRSAREMTHKAKTAELRSRLQLRWNTRTALEQQAEPVAWGMPDAEGNMSDSITHDEKQTDMKGWAQQYSTPLYTAPPQRKPLTEAQQVDCLVKSGCIGTVKMSFESGPYDITRPSINASMLIEAVEAAHGIKEGT